ncbi:MAG: hypothetical protein ACWGQW_03435 [bacterium]
MKVDDLIDEYICIRDDLDRCRKEFKEFEAECKERMAGLEMQLLEISNDTGVDSFKTKYGTAFRTTKDYARIAPGARGQLDEYVLRTGNLQIYTSHISKIAVKELMAAENLNPAEAGIDYVQEDVIQVRKPTKSPE